MSLSKFEKKKQKLLQKNARLQGKKNESNPTSQSITKSDKSSVEWSEMIKLLSSNVVLRPQELFEFFALLIQSFAGSNITVALNRNANSLSALAPNNAYNVANIECILPIINDTRWQSSHSNPNLSKYSIIDKNATAFGILTSRKTLGKSVELHKNTPYFLTSKFEWRCVTDREGVYISTMHKDYRVTGDTKFKQKIVDNSYRNTANIQEAVIICSNQYGYVPIFCSQNDIFYTDPRIQYRDIKREWENDTNKDDIIKYKTDDWGHFKQKAKSSKKTARKAKKASEENADQSLDKKENNPVNLEQFDEAKLEETVEDMNNKDTFNVSLSIMSDNFADNNRIVRLWTQSDGKVYVLRGDGILYNIKWTNNASVSDNSEEKKSAVEDVREVIRKLDQQQPNFKISARKGAFRMNIMLEVWKHDPNAKNLNTDFEKKCNKKLKECKLIKAVKCDKFDMIAYNGRVHNLNAAYDTMHTTLTYGVYYDSIGDGSVLYIAQNTFDRRNMIHSWELGFMFNENVKTEFCKEYERLYNEFMEKHKYLKSEECYIMFVDERKLDNKKAMIICGKYLVEINMLNTEGIKEESFGKVYGLSEIIPELSLGVNFRGAKWYYSYKTQMLCVFERLSVSSNYPYRFKQIALSSFQFNKADWY